jgi:hypothetical protein
VWQWKPRPDIDWVDTGIPPADTVDVAESRHPQLSATFRFCDSTVPVRLVQRRIIDTEVTDPAPTEHGEGSQVAPGRRLVFELAAVFAEQADYAARISHRPEHVNRIFLDANSRCWMAAAALESPSVHAIKTVLLGLPADGSDHRAMLAQLGLPDAVIDWVLA